MNAHGTTPAGAAAATGRAPVTKDGRSGAAYRRGGVVGAGVVAAVLAWALIAPGLGVPLQAAIGSAVQHVGVVAVMLGSLGAGLMAWGAVAVIGRLWPRRGRATWTVVALLAFLLSVPGPLGGLTPAAVRGLLVLHLVVGGVLLVGLRATLPSPTGLR